MKELTLGQKIRNYRKRAGLSQMDLEMEIGASAGTISRIENGQVNPTKETLLKLIEILQLSHQDTLTLFGLENPSETKGFISDIALEVISRQLSNKSSVNDTIRMVLSSIVEDIGFIYPSIWLVNGGTRTFSLKETFAQSAVLELANKILGTIAYNIRFDLEEDNLIAKSINTGEIQRTRKIHDLIKPKVNEVNCALIQRLLNVNDIVICPIKVGNKVLGSVTTGSVGIISHKDVESLNLFCSKIGIAISFAREYEHLLAEIRKVKNERTNPRTKN